MTDIIVSILIDHTVSYILVINTFIFTRFHVFLLYCFYHLFGRFIHANNRKILIVRAFINVKNLFHVCHKFSILFRRNYPTFYSPRLKFVFFSVLYTDT